jgi:hypothetical protein
MRHLTPVLLGFLLVQAGCQRTDDAGLPDESAPEALYFEAIGAGQAGLLRDTTEVALRTPEEWDAIKDSLRTVEPIREVDFSQTMLLVAALPQNSGGYRVQFESVEKTGDEILASYVVYAPGPDCMTIMALTLPFQVVAARQAEGRVTFRRRVELESCALD